MVGFWDLGLRSVAVVVAVEALLRAAMADSLSLSVSLSVNLSVLLDFLQFKTLRFGLGKELEFSFSFCVVVTWPNQNLPCHLTPPCQQ